MLEGTRTLSEDALADIAYLARSSNRIKILETLIAEPKTARDIEETTGIARSTLERIVSELEERGWVERTREGSYVATATGEYAMTEFTPLVGAMEALRTLGDAAAWLPNEELTVGLQHFKEATVRRPQPNATAAPSTYATQLMGEATEFACLVNIAPSLGFENAMINGVVEGRLTTKHVITDGELAVLRQNADRASRWRAYIEAGAELYCYDGRIPCNLLVIDKTVLILDRQPDALEGIESTNAAVRSWAHEMVEDYRKDAERIEAAAFT